MWIAWICLTRLSNTILTIHTSTGPALCALYRISLILSSWRVPTNSRSVPILKLLRRQLQQKSYSNWEPTTVNRQCIIANLKINSLPNKFEEIKEWLVCGAFEILSIQKARIDKTFPSTQFYVEGFKLYRRDRVKEAVAGLLCLSAII